MTNPYEPVSVPLGILLQKISRGMAAYMLLHLAQAVIATAWVYVEPLQSIQNQTLLLFGEMCFAANGFFILIGIWMIVRSIGKTAWFSFWMIDFLVSSLVFVLGLPAVV